MHTNPSLYHELYLYVILLNVVIDWVQYLYTILSPCCNRKGCYTIDSKNWQIIDAVASRYLLFIFHGISVNKRLPLLPTSNFRPSSWHAVDLDNCARITNSYTYGRIYNDRGYPCDLWVFIEDFSDINSISYSMYMIHVF